MQTIPLQTLPSQILRVVLGGQNVQINVYQKPQGLFVDVESNDVSVTAGTIARDIVPLIPQEYKGFIGNLIFIDTQGNNDPEYLGFDTRYQLIYLTAEEYDLVRQ